MYCYTIEQDDMDFDQTLPACDPSSLGEASPSSLSREQLPPAWHKNNNKACIKTIIHIDVNNKQMW